MASLADFNFSYSCLETLALASVMGEEGGTSEEESWKRGLMGGNFRAVGSRLCRGLAYLSMILLAILLLALSVLVCLGSTSQEKVRR